LTPRSGLLTGARRPAPADADTDPPTPGPLRGVRDGVVDEVGQGRVTSCPSSPPHGDRLVADDHQANVLWPRRPKAGCGSTASATTRRSDNRCRLGAADHRPCNRRTDRSGPARVGSAGSTRARCDRRNRRTASGVVTRRQDRLGQQPQRAHRRLEFVAHVGDESRGAPPRPALASLRSSSTMATSPQGAERGGLRARTSGAGPVSGADDAAGGSTGGGRQTSASYGSPGVADPPRRSAAARGS